MFNPETMTLHFRPVTPDDLEKFPIWYERIGGPELFTHFIPSTFVSFEASKDLLWFIILDDAEEIGTVWLEKKDPEVPDFETVKEDVEKRFREEKSKDLAREKSESVLKMAMNGKPFDDLKDEEGLSLFDTGNFSRLRTYIPRIGSSPELVDVAFSLTEENPLPDESFEVNGNYYVVRFKTLQPPEYEAFLDEKESLRKQQEQRKKQEVFRQWLSELRKQHGVKFSDQS